VALERGLELSLSDLRLSAVHKQFGARDVTRIIGGEKRHGLRDFICLPYQAQRRQLGDLRFVLLDLCIG
jgi:hypothetical protein